MRVLIVEDHLALQHTFADVAELRGHEVTAVATAEAAWQDHQLDPFPLILLDIGLPGMDGLTLCKQIRAAPNGQQPVIVLITGRSKPDDLLAGLAAGADDFLPKPVDLGVLEMRLSIAESRVHNRLELRALEAERTQLLLRAEMERANARFHALLEAAPDAVVALNRQGEIELVNAQTEQFFGYERTELVGKSIAALIPESLSEEQEAFSIGPVPCEFQGSTGIGLELRGRRKDGTEFPAEITVSPVEADGESILIAVIRDVTERHQHEEALRESEERLRQAQKMEAIGLLAGGIAHDFNNLLTVINGFSELLSVDPNHPARATFATEIYNAGQRAASLTAQLLAFSRRQVLQPEVLDLNGVVASMDSLLRRIIGEDIDFSVRLDPRLELVEADPGQLGQVILNLAANARDAMPHGGKLMIETANVTVDDGYLARHELPRNGPHVVLAVSDTGIGMDAETQQRMFEPFFTTKTPGHGTGLGLSTVYGIVKQTGGDVWVYSEPGLGTTFRIYLPVYEGDAREAEDSGEHLPMARGDETVLIVEDEPSVRGLACAALLAQGYNVLDASGGVEALEICAKHPNSIDLVITDLVMPAMSGRQLAGNIARLRPNSKILYMSGYTDDVAVRHGLVGPSFEFLQKPFTRTTLAQKVRNVLDTGAIR